MGGPDHPRRDRVTAHPSTTDHYVAPLLLWTVLYVLVVLIHCGLTKLPVSDNAYDSGVDEYDSCD